MAYAMTIGTRLAGARKAEKLSQGDLASEISGSQSAVASWEKDKNEPDLQTIRRLAKCLNVSVEWLAFGIAPEGSTGALQIIPELDLKVPAGAGSLAEILENDSETVVRRYGFPKDEFRSLFGARPDGVVIVEVIGDSMVPTLVTGERVFVNTNDRTASPPGIFVVWDGLGLVLKRVEFVPHSDPPRVRIMSDNARYEPYERELGEAAIQGRVIGSLQRR